MARINSASYEKLRSISRGKFSPQQFLRLKELAANTVGVNNSIFDVELSSLLTLYKSLIKEIETLEAEINKLVNEVHPHYMSIPGIGPISAAIIYAEYGDISSFSSPDQMLAFAGIEPGIDCFYLHTLLGNPKYLCTGIPDICCRNLHHVPCSTL